MKSAGTVGIAVMVSRVLGLVRDQVFTACFGVGLLTDAFYMAFRIPNLLRDLFAEGALSTAFVTVFARKRAQEGDEAAWRLSRLTMTLQCLLLGALVLLGVWFAPAIVGWMAHGYTQPGKMELTVVLTRILFPFILFVGMAALSMGVLNSYGHFGLPASASSFFNLGSIVVGVGLALILDPSFGETAIVCMAIGSLCGGILQWLVQVPALWKLGYRYRPAWNLSDPGLRDIGRLMGPALIGASAVQINVVINSVFASKFDGAVTMLAVAFRLVQLPIGLFGVAISTASLPGMAVAATLDNKESLRQRIEHALRLNAALCIPAACGLAILGVPLIGVLFQRGKFDSDSTLATARILIAFSIGLIAYASSKILVSAFYAMNRTAIPMCVSLGSIIVTFTLNWLLVKYTTFGAAGLALTTSTVSIFSSGILLANLACLVGAPSPGTWKAIGKIVVASAIMSGLVFLSLWIHTELGVGFLFWGNLSRVVVGVGLGALSYAGMTRWLKLEEVAELERALLRKLKPAARS